MNRPPDKFERELRRALRPVEPPDGFAGRVLARAARGEAAAASPWWHMGPGLFATRGFRWALAGALCLAFAAGGSLYHYESQRRAAGEAAKEQLMLALRVTASKLALAQSEVRQIGSAN